MRVHEGGPCESEVAYSKLKSVSGSDSSREGPQRASVAVGWEQRAVEWQDPRLAVRCPPTLILRLRLPRRRASSDGDGGSSTAQNSEPSLSSPNINRSQWRLVGANPATPSGMLFPGFRCCNFVLLFNESKTQNIIRIQTNRRKRMVWVKTMDKAKKHRNDMAGDNMHQTAA